MLLAFLSVRPDCVITVVVGYKKVLFLFQQFGKWRPTLITLQLLLLEMNCVKDGIKATTSPHVCCHAVLNKLIIQHYNFSFIFHYVISLSTSGTNIVANFQPGSNPCYNLFRWDRNDLSAYQYTCDSYLLCIGIPLES